MKKVVLFRSPTANLVKTLSVPDVTRFWLVLFLIKFECVPFFTVDAHSFITEPTIAAVFMIHACIGLTFYSNTWLLAKFSIFEKTSMKVGRDYLYD